MIRDWKAGEYVLTTGRRVDVQAFFDPNEQIEMRSDGSLWTLAQSDIGIEIGHLTPDERQELSGYFIARWMSWGNG